MGISNVTTNALQEAVRHMGEGGRIIMMGSASSDFTPVAGLSVYALTKGAIASFTHGLARDLGTRGITVNNIQPGPIDTDMNPAAGDFAVEVTKITAHAQRAFASLCDRS